MTRAIKAPMSNERVILDHQVRIAEEVLQLKLTAEDQAKSLITLEGYVESLLAQERDRIQHISDQDRRLHALEIHCQQLLQLIQQRDAAIDRLIAVNGDLARERKEAAERSARAMLEVVAAAAHVDRAPLPIADLWRIPTVSKGVSG